MTEDITGRLNYTQGRGGRPGMLCEGIQSGKQPSEI